MPSAHDLNREFTVLSHLGETAFPVPGVVAQSVDESVIGSPFMVMEFVEGTVLSEHEQTRDLSASQTDDISRLLVTQLANLHLLDPDTIGLGSFGRPQGYLGRQVKRWGEQWQITKTRELESMGVLSEWLATHVQDLESESIGAIVHGDFRLDNVILDHDLTHIRAILDWEMSTLGDPVADLAVMLVYWTEPTDQLRAKIPVAEGLTSSPGFWTRQKIAREYSAITQCNLDRLPFCLVLACYKLAIIMESLVFRSQTGHQLGRTVDHDEPMDEAVVALAELAIRLVDDPRIEVLGS
jgi:aminoglycoside phosphotransferase (APT) family kinase protein